MNRMKSVFVVILIGIAHVLFAEDEPIIFNEPIAYEKVYVSPDYRETIYSDGLREFGHACKGVLQISGEKLGAPRLNIHVKASIFDSEKVLETLDWQAVLTFVSEAEDNEGNQHYFYYDEQSNQNINIIYYTSDKRFADFEGTLSNGAPMYEYLEIRPDNEKWPSWAIGRILNITVLNR
jgi:hypothetical protein